jgi:succinyl-CoA synthetase beta subunit
VVLGLGGLLAEIHDDVALRLAPVDLATAKAMITEVKGLALLRGYRGQPAGDLDALADAIVAFSALAAAAQVSEAEINPLIVKADGEGVIAVDGLVRLQD